ncbi:hypothetical protein RRF57_006571 [Xylaria bambusicola]|uniref:Uncharacterized protein n=1 Tax=Xylaria bambusicola TaxID=326684 RepID=A0AAN7UQH3_9PEZI
MSLSPPSVLSRFDVHCGKQVDAGRYRWMLSNGVMDSNMTLLTGGILFASVVCELEWVAGQATGSKSKTVKQPRATAAGGGRRIGTHDVGWAQRAIREQAKKDAEDN